MPDENSNYNSKEHNIDEHIYLHTKSASFINLCSKFLVQRQDLKLVSLSIRHSFIEFSTNFLVQRQDLKFVYLLKKQLFI